MRKLLTVLICLLSLGPAWSTGRLILRQSLSGGCAQATTFIARTSGGMSTTEKTAMTTMICGLVTDGIITGNMNGAGPTGSSACGTGAGTLDALWIFATDVRADGYLNLCSTSFGAADYFSPTFTADQGMTANIAGTAAVYCSTCTLSTAGGNYSLNSASMGICVLTNDTSITNQYEMGVNATGDTFIAANLLHTSNFSVNDATGSSTVAATTSQGFWAVTRTGSGARAMYGPSGSSTALISDTQASTSMPTSYLLMGARNFGGYNNGTNHQFAAAFIGSGLTGAQYASIASRINTYVKAVNGGNGCF